MNRSLSRSSLLLITLVISISSCKPDRTPDPIQPAVRTLVLPETPYNYAEITLPASWDNDALDLFENQGAPSVVYTQLVCWHVLQHIEFGIVR